MDLSFYAPFPPCSFLFVIMIENEKGGPKMAIKFSKTDDLDKMFENFASFPDLEKTVEFPEEKKKAETAAKDAKKAK